jgi:hypothetical protein
VVRDHGSSGRSGVPLLAPKSIGSHHLCQVNLVDYDLGRILNTGLPLDGGNQFTVGLQVMTT